jgi:hypothetical protein
MAEIRKDNLEDALGKKSEKQPEISKEMEIGFHQGALNTLVNERNELIKVIQQVESVMQVHIKRLEELGINIKNNSEKKSN